MYRNRVKIYSEVWFPYKYGVKIYGNGVKIYENIRFANELLVKIKRGCNDSIKNIGLDQSPTFRRTKNVR